MPGMHRHTLRNLNVYYMYTCIWKQSQSNDTTAGCFATSTAFQAHVVTQARGHTSHDGLSGPRARGHMAGGQDLGGFSRLAFQPPWLPAVHDRGRGALVVSLTAQSS
jgi:hypothetical protein